MVRYVLFVFVGLMLNDRLCERMLCRYVCCIGVWLCRLVCCVCSIGDKLLLFGLLVFDFGR